MQLGDILVAKGILTEDDVAKVMEHQRENGGRFGDCAKAIGLVTDEQLDAVMTETPPMPRSLEDTGVDPIMLLQLMVKGMQTENLEVPSQIANAIKLPTQLVNELLKDATERKLLEALGQSSSGVGSLAEMRYGLSRTGREWALESLDQCAYFGPAPVSLEAFQERVLRQRITNEWVSQPMMKEAFKDLVIPDRFLSRLGPAVNSGTAMLLYGPAGNGKTTVAEIVGDIFKNVIYVPHCFEVDGQIVKVYDPSIHTTIDDAAASVDGPRSVRRERFDQRWVPCYRPIVITGGELTLEMLDLKFNDIAKFYEAPMHIKALNGTFLIDDFGRQRAAPSDILNRWIVPLNSRIDFLALHTGKSFELPFDELVIFSTNLHPDDLMDPAFQRRIAYKLETLEPDEELFRNVFNDMAKSKGLDLTEEFYKQVLDAILAAGQPLAYFQPKFVIEQVQASCKYMGTSPQFTTENIEDALANLIIQKPEGEMFGVARG